MHEKESTVLTGEEIKKEIMNLQLEEIQLLTPLREYESRLEAIDSQMHGLRIFQRKDRARLRDEQAQIMEEKRSREAEIWKKRNQIHSRIHDLKKLLANNEP